jgi:hypothetical protein
MKYAVVKSGIVDNIIEWDGISKYAVDGQLVLANDDTYVGGSYTNNAFVPRYTQEELDRMEAEGIAQAEAKAQLRTSVINKIATNLTSEEKAWLEENL